MTENAADSLRLVIANKKYSSWSLRAWIGLRQAGLSFQEIPLALERPEVKQEILAYSAAGLVPVLLHGGTTVYDSLAILEYLNDTLIPGSLLSADPVRRARTRSVAAEMHSGFSNLRLRLPMNLGREPGPITLPQWKIDEATQGEIDRVLGLWESLLKEFGGPFLLGDWSMADCMYLPIVTRFRTYMVDLGPYPLGGEYLRRMLAVPAFREWESAALEEPDSLPRYDR